MVQIYGYIRVSTDKQIDSPEVQRDTITRTAERNGHVVDAWFQDAPVRNADGTYSDAASGGIPITDRQAGGALCARLRKGDVVYVAKVDRAFRKLSDCVVMLDRWERLGVSLVLCDFPMLGDLSSPFGKAMIQMVAIFAEIERKLTSIRTKEALALRKRKGHANGKYPGYGFRWERRWDKESRKHVKVKVGNPEERQVMREIVKWKIDGHSWETITGHLTAQGIFSKENRPWSRARVQRAFQAELELQSSENKGIK